MAIVCSGVLFVFAELIPVRADPAPVDVGLFVTYTGAIVVVKKSCLPCKRNLEVYLDRRPPRVNTLIQRYGSNW